jgi:phosphotransacetylase
MPIDYGILADSRFNDELNFDEIHSKEDYKRAMKEFLDTTPDAQGRLRGKNLSQHDYVLEEMYEKSNAKERIGETAQEDAKALEIAQRAEKHRKRAARLRDEMTTAKDTRRATMRSVRVWKRRMGRMDIRGVDTRVARRLMPRNIVTRGDLRLKKYRVDVDVRGIKHYRSSITGRFTTNPFATRKKH